MFLVRLEEQNRGLKNNSKLINFKILSKIFLDNFNLFKVGLELVPLMKDKATGKPRKGKILINYFYNFRNQS